MLSPNFFNTVFVFPILNILVGLYLIFVFIKIPGAFGWAIIALTVLVRLILQPFFHKQMETAKKMQDLKPHLDRITQKHKNDKKQLALEQQKLFQSAGVNPASGCLFLIIQIPIFIALFNTLNLFLRNGDMVRAIGQINNVLYFPFLKLTTIDTWFFGFNLAQTPRGADLFYLVIPAVTGLLQFYQAQVSTPSQPQKSEEKEKPKDTTSEFQRAMGTQMKYIFPLLIAWFAYTLPVGLSLYWNVFSVFSIIQYRKLKTKSENVKTNG